MSGIFLNVAQSTKLIAKAAAGALEDNLQACLAVEKQDNSIVQGLNGYKMGSSFVVPVPARYQALSTLDHTGQSGDTTETSVNATINITSSIPINITTLEAATQVDLQDKQRHIAQAAISMAHDIEGKVLEYMTKNIYNAVGTPGSTTFSTDVMLQARERINKFLCPKDNNRYAMLDSRASRLAIGDRKTLQNPTAVGNININGSIGRFDGLDYVESEMLRVQTNGTATTGTVATTVATQGATTIALTVANNATITAGTVISFAGVRAVHPQDRNNIIYTFDHQFVVTANATANGSGAVTVTVSNPMYTTSTLRNINRFPTSGDVVTLFGGGASSSYDQNLVFHKSAFRLMSIDLPMPENEEQVFKINKNGLKLSCIRYFDPRTRDFNTRLDFVGSIFAVRPEWACRVYS